MSLCVQINSTIIILLIIVVLDLWSQEESDVAHLFDLVFHNQWDFLRKAQCDGAGKRRSLGEEVEVPQSEGKGNWFVEINGGLVFILGVDVGGRTNSNIASSKVTFDRKLDSFFGSCNND